MKTIKKAAQVEFATKAADVAAANKKIKTIKTYAARPQPPRVNIPQRRDGDGDRDGGDSDDSAAPPGRLLAREEVLAILNVTYPTLWGWVKEGHFPAPRMLGIKGKRGRIGWVEAEVRAWILSLPRRFPKGSKIPEVA